MQSVLIESGSRTLHAEYRRPANSHGTMIPGVVLCHGFAGQVATELAELLSEYGLATVLFRFSGYPPTTGHPIGDLDLGKEVEDTIAVATWLSGLPDIDASNIAIVGSSLGGTVALEAALQYRPKACAPVCPIVDGASFMSEDAMNRRGQRYIAPDEAKEVFAAGRRFARFDLVNIPVELRGFLPPSTPMEFSAQTYAELSGIALAEHVKAADPSLAPFSVLVMHARDDRVVPFDESLYLNAAMVEAGLDSLFIPLDEGDHFLISKVAVMNTLLAWLKATLR
jgi:dipeptidyl aminopeptidase/acylaminoacyl peptidase